MPDWPGLAVPQKVYTLEDDYGAPASGSVQSALQSAVTDILTSKGGGRVLLRDRIYDFDSITWPSIGLDQPTPTIEFVGPYMPQTVGFMPGVGLTAAQGGDMPAPARGAILRSSQATASTFGGLSAWSNFLPIFRNLIVRVPANPPWHGLDCGWCTGLVTEGVVLDQGRSWGDGSNPLSPGAIAQPMNAAVEGVIFPGQGNGGVCRARDLLITGVYNALRHSEHFDGDRVTIAKCVVAWRPADGWHAARIGRISLYWNAYGLQPVNFNSANPVTRLHVDELDFEEDPGTGHWYTTVRHVNDPNNKLHGRIGFHRDVPAGGMSFSTLRRGAAYLGFRPIGIDAALLDAVGFEGADSATTLPQSQDGQPAQQVHGTWGVSGQWAYIATVSGVNDVAAWETGLTQLTLHTRVRAPASGVCNIGLALFVIDANNHVLANVAATPTIQKIDAAAWTTLASGSPLTIAAGQEFDVRVTVRGRLITLYIDGARVASYTMTAAEWTKYSASTSHGFFAYSGAGYEPGGANGGRWDFLRVEQAGPLIV